LERPTAYGAIETYLRAAVDVLTEDGHPPGCLSIQGGLSCAPANSGIFEHLAEYRAAFEATLTQRLAQAAKDGDLALWGSETRP